MKPILKMWFCSPTYQCWWIAGPPGVCPVGPSNPFWKRWPTKLQGKALITSLNIEENREAAYRLNIHSIPTLVIFNDGEETRRFFGLQKADSLTKALEDAFVSP